MFIELVDALRCPVPHDESWLVLQSERIVARHIVDGTLGCPTCHAEYPISDGVADFSGGMHFPAPALVAPSGEQATRLAAFLGLDDALGIAILMGAWGSHVLELRGMVECPLLLVDPPAEVEAAPGFSILRTNGVLPIASAAARGVAIDVESLHGANEARVTSAVRVTRTAGRLVASATLPLPAEVRELARDAEVWVADREPAASPIVTLHVRRAR